MYKSTSKSDKEDNTNNIFFYPSEHTFLPPYNDLIAKLSRILCMIHLVKTPAKAQVRAAKFVSLAGQSQNLMYGLATYLAFVIVLMNLG